MLLDLSTLEQKVIAFTNLLILVAIERTKSILASRDHHTFPLSVRQRMSSSRKGVTCGRQDKS
jgi:hypothetical protein